MARSYFYQLPYDRWLAREKFMKQPAIVKAVAFICLLKMAASTKTKGNLWDECGNPYTMEDLADLVKCSPREIGESLKELTDIGVFKLNGDKEKRIWFSCPEMIDTESDRDKFKTFGKQGGRPKKNPL